MQNAWAFSHSSWMELIQPGSRLVNRSCWSRLFIYTEPFLIYTHADAVINPECSSYPKKAPAPGPHCRFRPLVRVQLLPSSQSRAHPHVWKRVLHVDQQPVKCCTDCAHRLKAGRGRSNNLAIQHSPNQQKWSVFCRASGTCGASSRPK